MVDVIVYRKEINLGEIMIEYSEIEFNQEVEEFKKEKLAGLKVMEEGHGDLSEIVKCLGETYSKMDIINWKMAYVNNFHHHLPGGYKRRSPTPDETKLQSDIDEVMIQLGLSIKEIAEWMVTRMIIEHVIVVFKLYVEMRKLGYKHYPDLTR